MAPVRTQIQAIVDTKIISAAVDSTKTMGSGLKAIYTALLDALYDEGTQTQQDIQNLILDHIVKRSLRGDVITGHGLTSVLTLLNNAVFGDYPTEREELEDSIYPYLRAASIRSDVTIGKTLRSITGLILDKIYDTEIILPQAAPVENLTAIALSDTEIQLTWENPA